MGVVGMLMALPVVADESEDLTLEVSASTSESDVPPALPRRRENARLNELRNCTAKHRQTYYTVTQKIRLLLVFSRRTTTSAFCKVV